MDESRGYDNGYYNHHGTRIETQWAERNSQGSMADTTDKNLFAINDTLVFPIFSINNIINDTLVPPLPKLIMQLQRGVLFPFFPSQRNH